MRDHNLQRKETIKININTNSIEGFSPRKSYTISNQLESAITKLIQLRSTLQEEEKKKIFKDYKKFIINDQNILSLRNLLKIIFGNSKEEEIIKEYLDYRGCESERICNIIRTTSPLSNRSLKSSTYKFPEASLQKYKAFTQNVASMRNNSFNEINPYYNTSSNYDKNFCSFLKGKDNEKEKEKR